MCLFQVLLIHATVASLLMTDSPTRMSISATMWLSPSCSHPPCYLQDRDEISDDVIIVQSRNRYVKGTAVVDTITVPSGINPRATVASIKGHFRGVKALTRPHFAVAHAQTLVILHYHECCIIPMQVILPTFQLDATVRAAFMPDFTLESLPIFISRRCVISSIFSDFLHS